MKGTSNARDITNALLGWGRGDAGAAEGVFRHLYEDMHRAAARCFSDERRGHTLQTTAIVHEAFIRLERYSAMEWRSRAHFLAFATRVMRQVLIDHARKQCRQKRGGRPQKVALSKVPLRIEETPEGLLALNEALERLAETDSQKAAIVEMRFFGGLSNDEVAEALETSRTTVVRQLRLARAWLYDRLRADRPVRS